jgi:magnesium chelatase accessory protein
MSGRYPDWNVQGEGWPNREHSAFVEADGYDWHVQDIAVVQQDAPSCLLIHGTGAATHSWREFGPLLAQSHRVIALDLPGHGFTKPNLARKVSLPDLARSLGLLLDQLGVRPDVIIGHSAGAAIGIELQLTRDWLAPLIALNPALLPFPGLAAKLFPALAKVLFTNPFTAIIFARMARRRDDVRLFLERSTGSQLDPDGVEFYHRLFRHSGHCDGAIRMMASWDLAELEKRLGDVRFPVMLVHGENDKAIPRSAIAKAAKRIPQSQLEEVTALGHLAHEENPQDIARFVRSFIE